MKNSSTSNSRDALRFFARCVLFILVGMMGLYSLLSVARVMAPPVPSNQYSRIENVLSHAAEVETLGLGSSHSRAIDFSLLGNAFPVWVGCCDLPTVEDLLHKLVPEVPNLHTTLISISYFSFNLLNMIQRNDVRIDCQKALGGLPLVLSDIPLRDHGKEIFLFALRSLGLALNSESDEVREVPFGAERSDVSRDTLADFSDILGREVALQTPHTKTDMQLLSEALIMQIERSATGVSIYHGGVIGAQPGDLSERSDIVRVTTATVERIVQFLQEREVRVVFYTPPYFFRYNKLYDHNSVVEMYAIMANLVETYGVEYYDCAQDPDFAYNPMLFGNGDHMNGAGARLFTEKLIGLMSTNRDP